MKIKQPKVSIILPTVRIDNYLYEAIESIIAQSFNDFELIIIINSIENPDLKDIDLLTSFDKRIKVIHCSRVGVAEALNAGLEISTGLYVARMDADDISLPDRLSSQVNFLDNNRGVHGVGSFAIYIDSNSSVIGYLKTTKIRSIFEMKSTLRFENPYIHPSVMLRSEYVKNFKYDTSMIGCEDWDLWIRFANEGLLIKNIPYFLVKYRLHHSQVTKHTNYADKAIALKLCLNKLTPSPLRIFPFQRFYLSEDGPNFFLLIRIFFSELKHIKNVFSFVRFIKSLYRAKWRNVR